MALKCIPDMPVRLSVSGIGPMRIRLRRHRSYWLRNPVDHERYMFGALHRLVKAGDAVYDVGANIGMYTRFIAGQLAARSVVAFEPMLENHKLLEANIALATPDVSKKVIALRMALSDRDGEEALQIDDMMSQSATLDSVSHGEAAQGRKQYGLPPLTELVSTGKLDTLVAHGEVPPPDVMKIDVEGAEMQVLDGAAETIARHQPNLAIETHGLDLAKTVARRLLDYGYHVFSRVQVGEERQHVRVDEFCLNHAHEQYDLHHLLASKDEQTVSAPVEDYH